MSVDTLHDASPIDVREAKKLVKKRAKESKKQARAARRGGSGGENDKARHSGHPSATHAGDAQRSSPGAIAWLLVALLASAGAAGSYYLFEQTQQMTHELAQAHRARAATEQRLVAANHQTKQLEAEAAKVQEEFAAAQELAATKAAQADELANKLSELAKNGNGELVREADGRLSLQLVDRVLFRSGEATLTRRGMAVLADVGEALNEIPDKHIWVQGHTDNEPIGKNNTEFASNWELSAARALTVVSYLEQETGVDPRRLAAVAFGEHRPVSRRKKARNRRIEIVLAPPTVALAQD